MLGYLDDLLLVPLGIYLALRLIPEQVIAASRQKADQWIAERKTSPTNNLAAAAIVLVWIALGYWAWSFVSA